MIDIKDKKDCCGCNACGDVCQKGAISFVHDEEGFLYPSVDKVKCVDCGLCDKVCPQLHVRTLKQNEFAEPKCYAAVHKNLVVLFDSTSGGAFTALASVVYAKGGFVGGAVWNEDFSIRQFISNNKKDLERLRSSKYAQSDSQRWYKAVKSAAETGKPTLVCGCPCQIAALKRFLGKAYDNLILVDFICRGNNSPLVLRKYLDWQEVRSGGKITYLKSKNKELGWRNLTTKMVFDNGKVVYETRDTSYFTKGYLNTNAFCRPSCYACQFKGLPRIADISIADFWGADELKLSPELDRNLGTSLVMINNSKGRALFDIASSSMIIKDITWQQAKAGNAMLDKSLPPPKCDRREFFSLLNKEGFEAIAKKYICPESSLVVSQGSLKRRFKNLARFAIRCLRSFRASPFGFWRTIRLNGLRKFYAGKNLILASAGTHIEGACNISVINGNLTLGGPYYYKKEPLKTSVGIQDGGKMIVRGETGFAYGADVEVFSGGLLEMEGGGGFNLGATIVCGNHIKIGRDVRGGRHVTIRDNNGGHYMNMPGYKNSKPVEIGDHVWLCEGCTIMPGVKIGAGAVIGAKAVVFTNVPANTLVVGNPAEVVCEQVEWKY